MIGRGDGVAAAVASLAFSQLMGGLGAIVTLALAASVAVPARAQSESTWVVAVTSVRGEDPAAARRVAERAGADLSEHGHTVLQGRSLAARMRERISAPMEAVPAEVRERIVSAVDGAVLLVAEGNSAEARAMIAPALREADQYAAALGRDDAAANAIVNLCLLLVRVDTAPGARPADAAVDACLRRHPNVAVDRLMYRPGSPMHPANIRTAVTERLATLRSNGPFLSVEAPAAEGRTCVVRVAGRVVADAVPARVGLPAARHAVQVECDGAPGRVHDVELPATGARIALDLALDEALGASAAIELTYASAEVRRARQSGDCGLIAARLETAHVLMVSTATASTLRVQRCGPGQTFPPHDLALDGGESVPRLVREVVAEVTGAEPVETQPAPPIADNEAGRPVLGPVLLGGAGLVAGAYVVYSLATQGCIERDELGECARERLSEPLPLVGWSIGGLGALAGAIIWFFAGGPSQERDAAVSLGAPGELRIAF